MYIGITLVITFIIIRLFYKLRQNKENLKIIKLKEFINQQERWNTPIFNNAGFVIGTFIFLLGIFLIISDLRDDSSGIPFVLIIGLTLFGLFMIYGTPFIKITKEQIIFQPLLFKIFGLSNSKNTIRFEQVKNITIQQIMPPFNALIIHTKFSKKVKLNTAFFNSEIGNAIFEIVKSRLTK